MRRGDKSTADSYVDRLRKEHPESEWTTLLTDPYFVENAQMGVHHEDSLYAATYNAFKAARYNEVRGNVSVSDTRFPLGANRDKFIFIGGLGKLNDGDYEGCIDDLTTVVKNYPQSAIAQIAGMIVKGVNEGRKLYGGKFDLDNIWERRSQVLNDSDSTAVRQFSADRNASFMYVIAYKPDSVDANRMLFELARYNFTSFMVRNFDIEVDQVDGLHRMMVKGFRNYDEALQYARLLQQQKQVATLIGKSRQIIISDANLPLLGRQFSYADYAEFYKKNFAPLRIATEDLLEIPTETVTAPQKDETKNPSDGFDDEPSDKNNESTNTFLDDEPTTTNQPSGEIIEEERTVEPERESNVVDLEEEKTNETTTETTILPEEEPTVKPQPRSEPQPTATEIPAPTTQQTPKTAAEEPAPTEKKEPKALEDDFYFGEEPTTPPTGTSKKSTQDQPDNFDDDEYYDLEGF